MAELLRTAEVFVRLVPIAVSLRRDRKRWIAKKKYDEARFQKNARRLLGAFLALGPVYIKLGQWLSSRADILPQPYMAELAKLQDEVPPAPYEQVRQIISKEIGPPEERFERIDEVAISGASLGQVHLAVSGGRQVAVKVRRPGIEHIVKKDITVLKRVLPLVLRFVDENLRFSARAMLAQFEETIEEELDYSIERDNLKSIGRNMSGYGSVIIPGVYDELSSNSVLTMEYISGTKVTDVEALNELGIDRQKLVIDMHKVFFTMLLRHAIFHADPHPGNISVTKEGRLILYDYGMVGRINDETRSSLVRLYLALVEKDPPRTVRAMRSLGMLAPDANALLIEQAIELAVYAMHGKKPDEMEIEGLMEIANRTMSKFPFLLPKNLALYMRMGSIIEGIYKVHDIDFKFVEVMREILRDEGLVQEAYVGEIRSTVNEIAKSVGAAISIAPQLKRLIDEGAFERRRPSRAVPAAIMSAAVFVGSALVFAQAPVIGILGMACSLGACGISLARARM